MLNPVLDNIKLIRGVTQIHQFYDRYSY